MFSQSVEIWVLVGLMVLAVMFQVRSSTLANVRAISPFTLPRFNDAGMAGSTSITPGLE